MTGSPLRVMTLSGFADEAADDIAGQIAATKALGWSSIEARSVDGVNIHDLDDESFARCAGALEDAGIGVCCFGSTIANWGKRVDEDFSATLHTVDRAIERMQRLQVKLIRLMSYSVLLDSDGRALPDQREAERFEKLRMICSRFTEAGVTPVHENCLNYGGMSWEHTIRLLEEVPGLKLVYDTGNPELSPDFRKAFPYPNQDSLETWEKLKPFAAHIHIKDGRRDPATSEEFYRFPGEGDCQVAHILADLMAAGYAGFLSIEPHMAVVFHDSKIHSPAQARFDNYVEYGRRTEALLRSLGCEVSSGRVLYGQEAIVDMPCKWREIAAKKLADCHIFGLSESERETCDGRKHGAFYLVDAPDWSGVIPVVDTPMGRCFVMIRQYRHGTGRISVEFPGGAIDPGEDPGRAVARELLEETGYRAEMIIPLGDLSPNPAFMTNTFHAFIAEGCYLDSTQALDDNEEIEVLLVPEREAIDMIGAEDYGHALMTATLFFYMRYRGYSE